MLFTDYPNALVFLQVLRLFLFWGICSLSPRKISMKRSISGQRYTVWPMDIVSDYYLPLIVKIGDVMRLNVLQKTIIVLSSEKAANDLLDKRSGIYSDRPRFPMLEM